MIVQLNKVHTELSILLEIPTTFFQKVEAASVFSSDLFPEWFDDVFGSTNSNKNGLYKKFEKLYDKYKAIGDKTRRNELLKAYSDGVQVENLCNRVAGISAKKLSEFPEVRTEMRAVLKHLWENSLKYDKFETKTGTNTREFVDEFVSGNNEISICPFCGIEGYMNLDGQSRLPLDHWMCKDKYPYSFVNFDNLVPIGGKCNASPAKGAKDVITLTDTGRAFYPFTVHGQVNLEIITHKTPTNPSEENGVYELCIQPNDPNDQDLFESWSALFNIKTNYNSFFETNLLNSWRNTYKAFIDKHEILNHANAIADFKLNLRHWKSSIQSEIMLGYMIYRAFIDSLLKQPDAYLHGLMEYFRKF